MKQTRSIARTYPPGVRVVDGFPLPAGGAGEGDGGEGGDGGGFGDGGGSGAGSGSGEGGGTGTGGEGGGEGSSREGDGQSDLQQQALDAIAALQKTGAEIPDALTAAVNQLKDARGEAANYRTKLRDVESKQEQHDQTMQALAKALGLDGDGDGNEPDPQQLQQSLTEKDAALRTQTIELSAFKAAPKHQADPQALLDSRSFIDAAAKLDPDGEKFTEELDALVKSTVEANPKLKASQAPAKGGADHTGGTGDQSAKTLEDAVTARMGG